MTSKVFRDNKRPLYATDGYIPRIFIVGFIYVAAFSLLVAYCYAREAGWF